MERAREAARASSPAAGAAVIVGGAVFAAAVIAALAWRAIAGELRVSDVLATAPMVATQTVGLLIAARRPGNRMAWMLCVMGSVLASQALLSAALVATGPDAWWFTAALWLDSKSFLLLWGAVIAVLLHFPTGTLPSPRWRPVWFGAIAALVVGVGFSAIKPGLLIEEMPAGVANPDNPTAAPALYEAVSFLEPVALLLLLGALISGLASLLVRYRSSDATQRLQIRWVVAACVVFVLSLLVNVAVRHLAPAWLNIADAVTGLAFTLIPVAVGVAILRHRLYDIDRVLNRTVVYAVLTVVLGVAYVLAVTAMRVLTGSLTGDSAVAVAASTLAVAAMFQPARRRIQDAVDRRFNRARYDAATTLRQFSVRLREEVDLETLRADLLAVVGTTMQPRSAGLWLREVPQ